jgi:hypothetical protein
MARSRPFDDLERLDGCVQSRGGRDPAVGGALNLNVHIHALVLDGVFARDRARVLTFHPTSRLTALDAAEALAAVEPRIKRLLDRRGLGEGDDEGSASDAWAADAPVLAGLAAASVQGPWRSGLIGALAFVAWVTRPRRASDPLQADVTRGPTGLTSRRASSCRPGNGIDSNVSAAMCCVRP